MAVCALLFGLFRNAAHVWPIPSVPLGTPCLFPPPVGPFLVTVLMRIRSVPSLNSLLILPRRDALPPRGMVPRGHLVRKDGRCVSKGVSNAFVTSCTSLTQDIPRPAASQPSLHMAFNYWFHPPSNLKDKGASKLFWCLCVNLKGNGVSESLWLQSSNVRKSMVCQRAV